MDTKTKIIIAIVALLGAYAFGRYASPVKVVTEIKTVEVEKKQTDTEKKKDEVVTIVKTKSPDGTEKTITTITQKTDIVTISTERKYTKTDDRRETTYSARAVHLGLLAGASIAPLSPTLIFGGSVSRDVLGPISVGVWGLNNGVGGVSVGLSF